MAWRLARTESRLPSMPNDDIVIIPRKDFEVLAGLAMLFAELADGLDSLGRDGACLDSDELIELAKCAREDARDVGFGA